MKRFIYIFIMLLWMISYATAQESLPCRGTATTVLNVRSGPGISYARVGQLSRGQEVNVIQKSSNNWVQIEFGSQRGYAYSKYLKFSPLPQKANSPPAKSSSGSSSWSFWSIVWNIITWGLGIYLGLVVLYWLLKILIISYFIVSASLTFTFRLLSLPFFFLNALQRYLAKPWFIFFKKNRFSNATNENLRFIFYFLQFPFYVLLFPLRIVNAVFFNLLVHCSFEMFNYVMEVILPSEDKEGHDDFIRWILFLPYRIIKYVVWHVIRSDGSANAHDAVPRALHFQGRRSFGIAQNRQLGVAVVGVDAVDTLDGRQTCTECGLQPGVFLQTDSTAPRFRVQIFNLECAGLETEGTVFRGVNGAIGMIACNGKRFGCIEEDAVRVLLVEDGGLDVAVQINIIGSEGNGAVRAVEGARRGLIELKRSLGI